MTLNNVKISGPKINLDFYSGEDLYSDGDVESEILDIVKSNSDLSEILKNDSRWPVLCHLSPYRRNLLEWFTPDNGGRLLEIGAGCGALTGLFCEKFQEVVAVELSRRRADIIARRNSKNSNLEIVVGNLNDISFDKKFNYITLIGVLEYAAKYTETDSPYLDFLAKIKTFLKPEGTLIIAIENKFGLKYWAGAKEDHNGRYFESIENYPNDSSVRTFGKYELNELLNQAGFKNINFYYPMPDYKLPTQVFSDDFLPDIGQLPEMSPNYDSERMLLFNESAAFDNIMLNKQFDFFANSFLLFCNNTGKSPSTVYSKYNRERLPKFQIETTIYKDEECQKAKKKPLTSEARGHISCLYKNYSLLKDYYGVMKVAKACYENDSIIFDYVNGKSLDKVLFSYLINRKYNDFYGLLDRFVECVRTSDRSDYQLESEGCSTEILDGYRGVDSETPARIINIDINLDNVYIDEKNEFVLIDYEWVFSLKVPVNVMIFRSLEYFFGKYQNHLRGIVDLKDLSDRYRINDAEILIYRGLEKRIQDYVMGKEWKYCISKKYKKESIALQKKRYRLKDIVKKPKLLMEKSITPP